MTLPSIGAGFSEQDEEIFSSTYEPTKEEILEYAIKIGIDPEEETNLIYLARQGLLHPLPDNWKPCYSKQVKAYYYYDRITKKSQWEHPIDVFYRAKIVDARKALSVDRSDSTSLGDSGFRSLKSSQNKHEIAACISSAVNRAPVVSQSVCSSTGAFENEANEWVQRLSKETVFSSATCTAGRSDTCTIMAKNDDPEDEESDSNKENNSQEVVLTSTMASDKATRDSDNPLSSKLLFNVGASVRATQIDNGPSSTPTVGSRFGTTLQSFTITGTGAQYLKSNKKPDFGSLELMRKSDPEVKGILRDSSLTYVRNKSTPNEDSASDEKKSVRFDIDLTVEKKGHKGEAVGDESWINFETNEAATDTDQNDKRNQATEENDDKDNVDEKDRNERGDATTDGVVNFNVHEELCEGNEKSHSSAELSEQDSEIPVVSKTTNRIEKQALSFADKNNGDDDHEEVFVRQLKQRIDDERAGYRLRLEEELHSLAILEEANIQNALAKEHRRYDDLMELEKGRMEEQHRQNTDEVKEFYRVKLDELKADYEEENAKEYRLYRETVQEEFDRRLKKVTDEHRTTMTTLQKNHSEIVEELERDLKMEEELLKKDHTTNLVEMKIKLTHELEVERQRMRETGEDRLYEKMRCEKRLLEDKYKCLKEKYTRLKTDVRISLERRKKRREQQQQQEQQHSLLTNSYETDDRTNSKHNHAYPYNIGKGGPSSGNAVLTSEKSSMNTPPPSGASNRYPAKNDSLLDGKPTLPYNGGSRKPLAVTHHSIHNNNTNNNNRILHTDDTSHSETTYSKNYFQIRNIFANVQCEDNFSSDSEFDKRHHEKVVPSVSGHPAATVGVITRPKRKIFTKTKSASTSKLNATKHERDASGRPCTPVENLRIQLKKLEELEDQIPDCNPDAPYHLRYPFVHEHVDNNGAAAAGDTVEGRSGAAVGSSNGSSELEFFKHRILLERDSVMRAKESLRAQKHLFKVKQRDFSIKQAMHNRSPMDHIFNEEKELTEMEVSLHRTRALLGEKVIRLRHLERSLQTLSEKDHPRAADTDRLLKPKETLSDLSSYSSSGFSSTELPNTDHNSCDYSCVKIGRNNADLNESFKYVEHLHAEIQEIWSLLNPGTGSSIVGFDELDFLNNTSSTITGNHAVCDMMLPPKPATPTSNRLSSAVPKVGQQPPVATQMQLQRQRYTANLLEKTRDLKNWLRQAKSEHEMLRKNSFD